ncbi:MAG: coproporphyrinogen III oxidase, partial [Saprospiraceae bacterium]
MNKATIEKYQVPVPRYTSYPTVPYWQEDCPSVENWMDNVRQTTNEEKPIGIYIHLPFCENLCTYCGCHKRITKNHKVELPYVEALLAEWAIYKNEVFEKPALIEEIQLGGGTPTFFAPKQIEKRITDLTKDQN